MTITYERRKIKSIIHEKMQYAYVTNLRGFVNDLHNSVV